MIYYIITEPELNLMIKRSVINSGICNDRKNHDDEHFYNGRISAFKEIKRTAKKVEKK